jgi:hypothetical protein
MNPLQAVYATQQWMQTAHPYGWDGEMRRGSFATAPRHSSSRSNSRSDAIVPHAAHPPRRSQTTLGASPRPSRNSVVPMNPLQAVYATQQWMQTAHPYGWDGEMRRGRLRRTRSPPRSFVRRHSSRIGRCRLSVQILSLQQFCRATPSVRGNA